MNIAVYPAKDAMPDEIIDLTIPLTDRDADDLLREWRWLVPMEFTPIQMTKFGDWFFADSNEHVHMLDLIEGNLQEVAPCVAVYNSLKNTPEKHTEWCLDGFVFRCHKEGLLLDPSQCYGWKIHPLLGGEFTFGNIKVFTLRVYQSIMGQISRQLHHTPPGGPLPPLTVGPT